MQKILYPRLSLRAFGSLLVLAIFGGLIAGVYGIVHDQITYTLSSEYFTEFKFDQFAESDPSLGDRAFAGVIGFQATSWLGLIIGWMMARLSMGKAGHPQPKLALKGMLITFGICVFFGVLGYLYGTTNGDNLSEVWISWQRTYQITSIADFYRVGCIHNMGYIGGLFGAILAGIYVHRKAKLI